MRGAGLKIAMIQDQPGSGIRKPYKDILLEKKPDILAFPEYYFVNAADDNVIGSSHRHDSILDELKSWSLELECAIIGGSTVAESNGNFYNRSYFVNNGEILGYYDKIHPYRNEGRGLIKKGTEYRVFDFEGTKIGVLICADVLYPDSFKNMKGLRPDLIFAPTTSPYRAGESPEVKFARDNRLFVEGAKMTNTVIFKICASGNIAKIRFQARSLVATPAGIAWRNQPRHEDKSTLILARLPETGDNTRLDIEVYRH
jgi:predicted amidohydrolase